MTAGESKETRLLVIEDDELLCSSIAKVLRAASYSVDTAHDGYGAIEQIKKAPVDLIISDVRIPGMDGVETVAAIKKVLPGVKTILITAFADDSAPVRALNLGVDAYLLKPFRMQDLLDLVARKLEEARREGDVARMVHELKDRYREILATFVRHRGVREAIEELVERRSHLLDEELRAILSGSTGAPPRDESAWRTGVALLQLGHGYRATGELDVAAQAYHDLLEGAPEEERELLAEARYGLAAIALASGDRDRAASLLNDAFETLGDTVTPLQAQLWFLRARCLSGAGERDGAREALLRARSLFQEWDRPREMGATALFLAYLALQRGDEAEASSWVAAAARTGEGSLPGLMEDPAVGRAILVFALRDSRSGESPPFSGAGTAFSPRQWLGLLARAGEGGRRLLESLDRDLTDPAIQGELQALLRDAASHEAPTKIYGFGKLRMFLGTRWVPDREWKRRKTRSLLLYLLLHPTPSLEQLLEALWPEVSPDRSKGVLYSTVFTLRKLLEQGGIAHLLVAEGGSYRFLHDTNVWVDFHQFARHVKRGKEALARGERIEGMLALREAEQCYGGEFFEECYEDWAGEARERFRQQHLETLLELGNRLREEGKLPQAGTYFERALKEDNTCEEACLGLLRVLQAQGRFGEGARLFIRFEETVRRELGVDLSPALRAIYRELRAVGSPPSA